MKNKKLIYELFMSILALIAVVLSIIDITMGMNEIMIILDTVILITFIVDYIVRFIIAKDKSIFIKSNVFDLIAIIPFNSAFKIFRVAKLAKLTRIAKLSKLSKIFTYVLRFSERVKIFFNTNGFKYTLAITGILILLGTIGISQFENMQIGDALWWAFVTATTVGYGDISPSTDLGRLIAVALMITGIGLIGSLTSTITSYFFTKNVNKSPKYAIINSIQKQLENIDDLSSEDIDEIYVVLKALINK